MADDVVVVGEVVTRVAAQALSLLGQGPPYGTLAGLETCDPLPLDIHEAASRAMGAPVDLPDVEAERRPEFAVRTLSVRDLAGRSGSIAGSCTHL